MFKLTRVESYCLIQCCHCRMSEIDKAVSEIFVEISEKQPDDASLNAIVALDGERFMVERLLHRLWDYAKSEAFN